MLLSTGVERINSSHSNELDLLIISNFDQLYKSKGFSYLLVWMVQICVNKMPQSHQYISGHPSKFRRKQTQTTKELYLRLNSPAVKHGDGGTIIWAYFAATGPGCLVVTELTTNSFVYQSILESYVRLRSRVMITTSTAANQGVVMAQSNSRHQVD